MDVDNTPAIEFLPWYAAGEQVLRCEGDEGCGSMVMSDDVDKHLKWHDKVWPYRMVEVVVDSASPERVIEDIQFERRARSRTRPGW